VFARFIEQTPLDEPALNECLVRRQRAVGQVQITDFGSYCAQLGVVDAHRRSDDHFWATEAV
jgi:hypothetical protein